MFNCPKCPDHPLTRIQTDFGVLWMCSQCEGRAVTLALLRHQIQESFLNTLWQEVRSTASQPHPGQCLCPACRHTMSEVSVQGISELVVIDVCKPCQFIWFDTGETSQLPISPPSQSVPDKILSPKVQEAIALAKVKSIRDQADRQENIQSFATRSSSVIWPSWGEFICWLLSLKIKG